MPLSQQGTLGIWGAENDWNQYLRKLQARQQQQYTAKRPVAAVPTVSPVPPGGVPTPIARAAPAAPPGQAPLRQVTPFGAGVGITSSGQNPSATTAVTSTGTARPSSGTSGSGSQGQGKGTKADNALDTVTRPGRFYSSFPGSSIGALAGDVGASSRQWAKYNKYGGAAYGNALAGLYADPRNMMLGMGVGSNKMTDPQDYLDWQNKLFNIASGKTKVGGNYGYFSGKDVVKNVLGAKKDNVAGSLGTTLNDATQDPGTQVKNVVGILTSALQSVISPEALQAYQAMLGQLGDEFVTARMQNPKQWGGVTFNNYLLKKLGSGGGLY